MPAEEKRMYPNLGLPLKNKLSGKKKYFTINLAHLIHKACQMVSTLSK
jgi:hypothetical protein